MITAIITAILAAAFSKFGVWIGVAGFIAVAIGAAVLQLRPIVYVALGLAAVHFYSGTIAQFERARCVAILAERDRKFASDLAEATALDTVQRDADAERLAARDREIQRLNDELLQPDNICFDGPDADRVRDLWKP